MTHELECPHCKHIFYIEDDYISGDCPNCGVCSYYWDYVLDDETFEELLSGYVWNNF